MTLKYPRLTTTKRRINIWLDHEILAFFGAGGKGYHARMRQVLRDHVQQHKDAKPQEKP